MSDCTHDCSPCGENCGERTAPQDFRAPANGLSHTRRVITVVSGKGGTGKGLVTSSLAVTTCCMDKTVDVLDAGITGPSISIVFGVHTKAEGNELGIYPAKTKTDIEIMSLNLSTENETDPMAWHGPAIAGAVKQFWTDVIWGDVDYLFADMSPGAGDVPLTVFQFLPVDGIVVVVTPQDLASMIVTKAVRMVEMVHIPVLGLVENYSYFCYPDRGKEYAISDESHIERAAATLGLKMLARLPIDPAIATACDTDQIEELDPNHLTTVTELLAG